MGVLAMGLSINETLGVMLIGTWVNTMLFMLEIVQTIYFFVHFDDTVCMRGFVLFMVVIDSWATTVNCACLYEYCVHYWGDVRYLTTQNWEIAAYCATLGLSAAIMQAFLIRRFWVLSKNWIMTSALSLLTVASVGAAIATAVVISKYPLYEQRHRVVAPISTYLSAAAGADVAIAGALVWKLHSLKSSFKATSNLIKHLTRNAIQSGAIPAMIAVITLITYLTRNESNVPTGFAMCLGRIYSLTVLYNLNTRESLRDHLFKESTHRSPQRPVVELSGIQVQRTVVRYTDSGDSVSSQALATPPSELEDRVREKKPMSIV